MGTVCILRHVDCEGPGYLAEFLDRNGIPWKLVALDQGEPVPGGLEGIAGLVLMGGPMSVNDSLPWIEPELALIREAVARGLPVLGHCLGGQLIAKALGGQVKANPVREIGWHPVEVIDREAAAPWLGDDPGPFEVFHWHGETFTPPPAARPFLASRWCAQQAFSLGSALALQFHVEMTEELVRTWAQRYAHELIPSPSVQDADAMCRGLEARIRALHRLADRIYGRWITGLGGTSP
ncbi:type 1 glutamine amidotransferase [Inmirania thermothiophila]|uniref:GMP synthase-like glutamine amidotransferase n=1 Tax=Inmirania thermothiophila TaxID=1750597 RepID=A0A3N1XSV0_9GAMM|nr:type 1 glutamine amidotransferase [Inmirania thermothiophila]ROR29723.1 GMP synthase-like glutamine amidotransferase [Inmirania thermothiophila]